MASAGGIPALIELLNLLERPFPLPVIIAQHLPRGGPSQLPSILNWHTGCTTLWIAQDEQPAAGTFHVVPPGQAVRISKGYFDLQQLPNQARSWLDVPDLLFHSISESYGPAAIAVTLSGMLPAGIAGLRAIGRRGGITMAQNRTSSKFFGMPEAAIDLGKANIVFSPARIGEALNLLAEERCKGNPPDKVRSRNADGSTCTKASSGASSGPSFIDGRIIGEARLDTPWGS